MFDKFIKVLDTRINPPINVNSSLVKQLLLPFLKHGIIVLSSQFSTISSILSPSPIKHCSFCYFEGDDIFIIDFTETGFKKRLLEDFLKEKKDVYIVEYFREDVMRNSVESIFEYEHKSYGFIGDDKHYCYKLVYDLYKKYDKETENHFRFFKVFGLTFINSNTFFNNKYFKLKAAIISNNLIKF